MRFGILGALEVLRDGQTLELGGPQPRTVLALLLTASGRIVPSDVIIDALWGETPPASAAGTLQSYISRLRRALEPERARGSSESTLAYEPPGYRLLVDEDDVDFRRFERLAGEGPDMLDAGVPFYGRQPIKTLIDELL